MFMAKNLERTKEVVTFVTWSRSRIHFERTISPSRHFYSSRNVVSHSLGLWLWKKIDERWMQRGEREMLMAVSFCNHGHEEMATAVPTTAAFSEKKVDERTHRKSRVFAQCFFLFSDKPREPYQKVGWVIYTKHKDLWRTPEIQNRYGVPQGCCVGPSGSY